ncbi:MAG: hypothetical protein UR42_C0011G0003 [Candidatus Roizmanbacteria bacterium GW2011_GWA2_33_33]|uniref:Uncharacterized protein n=1 Tax=Candidatus Roizmanbacteria bacterium GW2011_GWA2_33_33 TaxID=1618476 RepID=A0A0G0AKH7_9BACT|nr:MAG: hypothetical protein UR42_C0011G0003 [Candidatus Roizmanbacteria bacterium GW2011_GWA2_33_33]
MFNIFLPLFTVSAQIQDWETGPSGNCVVDGVPTLKCLEIVKSPRNFEVCADRIYIICQRIFDNDNYSNIIFGNGNRQTQFV